MTKLTFDHLPAAMQAYVRNQAGAAFPNSVQDREHLDWHLSRAAQETGERDALSHGEARAAVDAYVHELRNPISRTECALDRYSNDLFMFLRDLNRDGRLGWE